MYLRTLTPKRLGRHRPSVLQLTHNVRGGRGGALVRPRGRAPRRLGHVFCGPIQVGYGRPAWWLIDGRAAAGFRLFTLVAMTPAAGWCRRKRCDVADPAVPHYLARSVGLL